MTNPVPRLLPAFRLVAAVACALPAAAPAQNLFTNGSFETGTLAGWSEPAGATIVSGPVHSGN